MTRLVPEVVEGLTLDVRLFHILNELGVTEVHLCEHAIDQLKRRMRSLYVSSNPIADYTRAELDDLDVGWAGTLCGIKFFRDTKSG